jgi:adenylate cyclase
VVGCGELGGADEGRTLSHLRGLRSDLIDHVIAAHHGRIVKRTAARGAPMAATSDMVI